MATSFIGQIVYNVDGVPDTVPPAPPEGEKPKSLWEILTTDIIGTNGILGPDNTITRLSVQGEPGLKLNINNNIVMIGRTGIYELDERIPVEHLSIIPIKKYKKDEELTKAAQQNAIEKFKQLKSDPDNYENILSFTNDTWSYDKINRILIKGDNDIPDISDWVAYYQDQNKIFNEGYIQYLQGKNGIYVPDGDSNAESGYERIYNLIIDYVYQPDQDTDVTN